MNSQESDLLIHENFHATKLNNSRTIAVYLPPSYDSNLEKRYPVLYMHDGQNIFDAATSFIGVEWGVDETVERLISEKKIPEIIVVGIYNNSDRFKEYAPYVDKKYGGGNAALYADFVIQDLKPFIDKTYRTLPDAKNTAVMGSSLGGLVSLYMAWNFPQVFSMAGVLSPAIYWSDHRMTREIDSSPAKKDIKIYLDMGTEEGTAGLERFYTAIDDVRDLRDVLLQKGFTLGKDLEYFEDEGAKHNESFWAKRVHKPILFFFGLTTTQTLK